MNAPLRTPLRVPATHPCLAGEMPGHPVVPAVVLLDAVAALLAARHLRLAGVAEAKFVRPLAPGHMAMLELAALDSGLWRFRIEDAVGPFAHGRVRVAPA